MDKEHIPFYVINDDFNKKKFYHYDIMPYLIECFNNTKRNKPKTFEEFKEFVKSKSMYQYWARCEYEIVLSSWVGNTPEEKIDVYWQIMMNIDVITTLLMNNVKKRRKKK